jgi:hypothetical protein
MSQPERPCLSLAIKALNHAELGHFAIWVVRAPVSSGYVHEDTRCTAAIAHGWQDWQAFFSIDASLPRLNYIKNSTESDPAITNPDSATDAVSNATNAASNATNAASNTVSNTVSDTTSSEGYGSVLMQELGLQLWRWLFSASLQRSLALSQGIALGQREQLRISLDVRDPNVIDLPWEIATPQPGQPAIALDPHLAFSRTSSDVMPLAQRRANKQLRLVIVVGDDVAGRSLLEVHTEAMALAQAFNSSRLDFRLQEPTTDYHIETLIQPSPEELIECLDRGNYHVFLYLGHGQTAPDGGELQLSPDCRLSGSELAQVLVRSCVSLALINACWGARSYCHHGRAMPRSSLAETLIHHGVPAVIAMRDAIADEEARSFTAALAQAIISGLPIDAAVATARQQLLTIYKFNQPAWTLPVLYMHPEFDGHLLEYRQPIVTELPDETGFGDGQREFAYLHDRERGDRLTIRRGLMRVGRTEDNDIIVPERWVSSQHAEIFFRQPQDRLGEHSYVLRDRSRYGTLVAMRSQWRKVHHQEIVLQPGMQLKFGSSHGRILEFLVEMRSTTGF